MKQKNGKRIIVKIALIIIASVCLYYTAFYLAHFVTAVGNSPKIETDIEDNLKKLPSDKLIGMLRWRYIDPFYDPYNVLRVLAERQEKKAVPEILKLLKSKRIYYRQEAMYALGRIKDERAIESLMQIVQKDQNDRDYLLALKTLSKMHYDKVYPTILQMEKEGMHVSWVVDMLENFPDKPQTKIILEKIAEENPENYIRDKAKKALKNISQLK